jgi:signal transduction histidine kinase
LSEEQETMQRPDISEQVLPAELLSTISHEFRSPLTTIKGYATTLLQREHQIFPEERREFLEAIRQAGARLEHLVNRFLELVQLETHAYSLVSVPVDPVALAREALTAASTTTIQHTPRAAMPGSFTHLILQAEEEKNAEPNILCGDRRLLRLMLDVLLENALLYSPPDKVVTVGVRSGMGFSESTALSTELQAPSSLAVILPARFAPEETVTEIWVADQGRGLAPHDLIRIFERFSRVDTSLTREVSGLGLGLTLCKYVVALHKGMLWVESAVGVGSTFHVVLPAGTHLLSEYKE